MNKEVATGWTLEVFSHGATSSPVYTNSALAVGDKGQDTPVTASATGLARGAYDVVLTITSPSGSTVARKDNVNTSERPLCAVGRLVGAAGSLLLRRSAAWRLLGRPSCTA